MDLGLEGRVALVAASSRGLGRATALALGREGARVAICARDAGALAATAGEIREETGAQVVPIVADLTDAEQIHHLADETLRQWGRIDVLVTNAGGPPAGFFDELGDADWLGAVELTLLSAVRLMRAVLPAMRAQEWGRIINITSVSVKQPIDTLLLSNSLRMAVVGLAKTLALQEAPHGITVNNVAPGWTLTERVDELFQDRAARSSKTKEEEVAGITVDIPVGRLGDPSELAAAITFLASERAAYITGVTLPVDGGYIKGMP
jgi:3-oxoacyl-[acyl-carrier protein] reductase